MTAKNVRWYETRQDRASDRAERLGRAALRLQNRAFDLEAKARVTKAKKARAALEEQANRLHQRSRRLGDSARAARLESSRYGKAKAKVGKYDSVGGGGWSDRDRVSARRRSRRR